jgi:urease accessory protein
VVTCLASSPLQLLAPRARGRAVWVLAASHGGGLVPGDAIELDVTLGRGATACLGTQAETKVYRDAGAGGASHRVTAAVGAGALLALVPDPVSPFAGSRYHQLQRFELAAGASLVVLDAVTAGRAARGERWAFAGWRTRNEVRVAERLVLADGVCLEAGRGPPIARRLDGVELLATLILVGPRVAVAAREILEAVSGAPASGDAAVLEAASPLADGVLLRIAARSVEGGMATVRSHLAFLAAPLDGDPLLRRP